MEKSLWSAVEALAMAINARNSTLEHSQRVAFYAVQLAKVIGWNGIPLQELRLGALLHDIGHITYPDSLINRQFLPLTIKEEEIVKSHTSSCVDLIKGFPMLDFAIPYILSHQEWINGTGYPLGLKGEEIPEGVQIVSIADIFEALHYPRLYRGRSGLSLSESLNIMKEMSGKRWRSDLYDIFSENIESFCNLNLSS